MKCEKEKKLKYSGYVKPFKHLHQRLPACGISKECTEFYEWEAAEQMRD